MLTKTIIFELRRAVHEKNFKISMLLGGFIAVMDLYTFFMQYKSSDDKFLLHAWLGTDFQFAYNELFYVLLPVIACLPYGSSYYQDINSGYDKNLLIRTTRKNYIIAKGIAVYLSSFAAVTIPLLLNLFLAAGLYRNGLPQHLDFTSAGIIDCNMFPILFSEKPVFYCLVFILIDGLFAGVLGLFSMAAARWCRSAFTVTVLPFVFYIVTGTIMVNEDGTSSAMLFMLNPVQNYICTYGALAATYVFMTAVCSFVIWMLGRRRDVI